MLFKSISFVLFAVVSTTLAQLATFRATIPGSLHQCEKTNFYFFQTGNRRPLSVLFLPASKVPPSLKSGNTTIQEMIQYSPLLALSNITTPDNQQYNFTLQIRANQTFDTFVFLPDGTGKNMNLTRTVKTALPSATNCLRRVRTTLPGYTATTTATATATNTASAI